MRPGVFHPLGLAAGESTINSKGAFTVKREGDRIFIEGIVTHESIDAYDFTKDQKFPNLERLEEMLDVKLPSIVFISAEEMKELEDAGLAAPYEARSQWQHHVTGEIKIRDGEVSLPRLFWTRLPHDQPPDTPLAHRQARKYFWVALRKLTLRVFFAGLAILIIAHESHYEVLVALPESDHIFRYADVYPARPFAGRYREIEVIDLISTTRIHDDPSGEGHVCLYHGRDPQSDKHWIRSIDLRGTVLINLDDRCVLTNLWYEHIKPQRRMCQRDRHDDVWPTSQTEWHLIGMINQGPGSKRYFTEGATGPDPPKCTR